MTNNFVYVF